MTNKERLEANNAKIEAIQKTLNNKILKAQGKGDYFVKVVDYDGTILKEENLNSGDTFELPTPPSHDRLVFQEWSCSQEIVDNTITITDNNVMVGAVYTTTSGLSEFDIELTKRTGLVVNLILDGVKDWGDGTSDSLTTHTYSDYGNYMITCDATTISSSVRLKNIFDVEIDYMCVNARLGNFTNIGQRAFYQCSSLKTITIPNTITRINSSVFESCYSLTTLIIPSKGNYLSVEICKKCYALENMIIPNGVDNIRTSTCGTCYVLKNVVIPSSITTIGNGAFQNCHALKHIKIPDSVTSLVSNAFSYCEQLTHIIIPINVTTISNNLFSYCHGLRRVVISGEVTTIDTYAFGYCQQPIIYDFTKQTIVPTLSNTQAFIGMNKLSKIIVPDALYEEWIVATNWTTWADYIYKASEVQE